MCADAVQEVTVVAHHQYGVLELAQVLFQPLYSLQVKVVGGLVKQQVVGIAEQSLCQHHAHLLLAGEFSHQLVVQSLLDAKAGKQASCIALSSVAAHLGKLVLQFCHSDTVLVGEVGLAVKSLTLLHHLPHGGVSHQNSIQYGFLVVLEVVLRQHGQTLAGAQFHCALCRFQLATDGLQQSRLAGAVGTDYSVDVSACELHVHVLVKDSLAELYGYIAKCNHFP